MIKYRGTNDDLYVLLFYKENITYSGLRNHDEQNYTEYPVGSKNGHGTNTEVELVKRTF